MKITRSFTRKINLGNYETADFYACYEDEIIGSEDIKKSIELTTWGLYELAKADVEKSVKEYLEQRQVPTEETLDDMMERVIATVRAGKPIKVEEYERVVDIGGGARLQDAKRAFKRDNYKTKQTTKTNETTD